MRLPGHGPGVVRTTYIEHHQGGLTMPLGIAKDKLIEEVSDSIIRPLVPQIAEWEEEAKQQEHPLPSAYVARRLIRKLLNGIIP
jgi:hypothetical protein